MDGIIDEIMGLLEDAFDKGLIYELLDLLEGAFRRGLIDRDQLSLASTWVKSENVREH